MTRWWPDGHAVAVVVDTCGTPVRVQRDSDAMAVVQIRSRWRIDEQWWRERIWRDYWLVITDDRQVLTLYQELPAGGWRLQRLLD